MSFATSLRASKSLLACAFIACSVPVGHATVVDWGPKGHLLDAFFVQPDGTLRFANGHGPMIAPVSTKRNILDEEDAYLGDGFYGPFSFPFYHAGASTPTEVSGDVFSLRNSGMGEQLDNFGYYSGAGDSGGAAGGAGGGAGGAGGGGGGSGLGSHSRSHARIMSEQPDFISGFQPDQSSTGDFSSAPTVDLEAVPEASTALFGLALTGIVGLTRRRKVEALAQG